MFSCATSPTLYNEESVWNYINCLQSQIRNNTAINIYKVKRARTNLKGTHFIQLPFISVKSGLRYTGFISQDKQGKSIFHGETTRHINLMQTTSVVD